MAIQDQKDQAVTSAKDLIAKRWPSDQFQGYIMNLCGLFISVHEGNLSFIHQTARDFPTKSKNAKEEGFWKGTFNLPNEHGTISRQCQQYLLLPDVSWKIELVCDTKDYPSLSIRNRQYPFLSYSAQYWNLHFIEQETSLAERYTGDARALCDVEKHRLSTWAPIFNRHLFRTLTGLTDLLVACSLGISQLVQVLLDEGADVNIQGEWSLTALQAASLGGFQQVVQILLDNGADIIVQFGLYGTSLQAASLRNNESIVEILLKRGANVNTQVPTGNSALQAASAEGNERIVEILLKWGANVNLEGGDYNSAHQAASSRGHERIVEMLLKRGANINTQGGSYHTAFQAAAFGGYERTVEILLKRGANVNVEGGYFKTALRAASAAHHERIVEILEQAARADPCQSAKACKVVV